MTFTQRKSPESYAWHHRLHRIYYFSLFPLASSGYSISRFNTERRHRGTHTLQFNDLKGWRKKNLLKDFPSVWKDEFVKWKCCGMENRFSFDDFAILVVTSLSPKALNFFRFTIESLNKLNKFRHVVTFKALAISARKSIWRTKSSRHLQAHAKATRKQSRFNIVALLW